MARLSWVAAATGGRVVGEDVSFDSVSTDTRSIEPGQLFVALRGVRYDAATFVAAAVERGAVAAVVPTIQPIALPQVVVPDAGKALQDMGADWRQRFAIPVLGVTGSNGKTTLKEMMGAILRAHFRLPGDDGGVLVTWGNLNNHVGVPISLLWLSAAHRAAVIEMGASGTGEIAVLTRIARPTVGVLTNAGPAHLAGFGGTIRGVAEGKGELFAGLQAGAVAVVNRDDPYHDYWRGLRQDVDYRSFGLNPAADFRATGIVASNGTGLQFVLKSPVGDTAIHLPMAGAHNIQNALAAAAATLAAGATLSDVRDGLEGMRNVKGRLRPEPGPAGSTIYDDSYNANPGSVGAAIHFLAGLDGQRWFVLGDMAELGPSAIELHRDIGALAARSGIDRFFAVGPLAQHAAAAFGPRAHWAADVGTLAETIRPALSPDVRLLVKGSRSAGLERLVKALNSEMNGPSPGAGGVH